ncbi:hypothetical protein BaRGS_00016546 [Batillaria attramentaria]|uniref:Uncharacterized protein n=1 Tax=Batillaria attramentaria TaxID=370345 RepID=A0ABD0KZM0_9CAEN
MIVGATLRAEHAATQDQTSYTRYFSNTGATCILPVYVFGNAYISLKREKQPAEWTGASKEYTPLHPTPPTRAVLFHSMPKSHPFHWGTGSQSVMYVCTELYIFRDLVITEVDQRDVKRFTPEVNG